MEIFKSDFNKNLFKEFFHLQKMCILQKNIF